MSGQPTDEQVRAGADALVRLRTQAPSLAELADEDQEFWLADARAVLEAAGPRPSQGHGIPTDQLAAYVRWADREAGLSNDDPVEQVARASYAVGFAAALGHRITVAPDGCGLLIGDRVDAPDRTEAGGNLMRGPAWPPESGRCGSALTTALTGYGTATVCALPAGHPGWHRSDGGTEWGRIYDDPDLAADDRP